MVASYRGLPLGEIGFSPKYLVLEQVSGSPHRPRSGMCRIHQHKACDPASAANGAVPRWPCTAVRHGPLWVNAQPQGGGYPSGTRSVVLGREWGNPGRVARSGKSVSPNSYPPGARSSLRIHTRGNHRRPCVSCRLQTPLGQLLLERYRLDDAGSVAQLQELQPPFVRPVIEPALDGDLLALVICHVVDVYVFSQVNLLGDDQGVGVPDLNAEPAGSALR